MERADWLIEKRRLCEERMDALFAPVYDGRWGGYINPTHRRMLETLLALCPAGGKVLDAACGTGKYWPVILESGRSVVGADQSGEMLRRAQGKFPRVPVRKLGLQELDYEERFDGLVCIDAMENVFPEDWPRVLGNFHRALRPRGHLYLTTEIEDETELAAAYEAGRRMGLPLVEGEHAHEGGYHFYPPVEQVKRWTREAGFEPIGEAVGDGYHHLLASKA